MSKGDGSEQHADHGGDLQPLAQLIALADELQSFDDRLPELVVVEDPTIGAGTTMHRGRTVGGSRSGGGGGRVRLCMEIMIEKTDTCDTLTL